MIGLPGVSVQRQFVACSISMTDALLAEPRHLAALVAVVDHGTFSAAADELGYTQSAVSQQVAALERTVGTSLLTRPGGPRRVVLTPAGEALVGHARAVLARLLAARADLDALASGERGTLRVGTMQSVGTKVLPQLLRRFREQRPGVTLSPQETFDHAELVDAVESGRFDLSFAPLPVRDGPFMVRRVLDDPFVLVAPADATVAGARSVSLRQAARLPLIGFLDEELDRELLRQLRRTGTEPSIVFRSNDNPTIQGFVAARLGYALMPRLTVDEDDPEVAVVPVVTGMPPRSLGLLSHADRQLAPYVAQFADLATDVCAEVSASWAPAVAEG
jgi:DNA-binding transcriptional LysR family regulator